MQIESGDYTVTQTLVAFSPQGEGENGGSARPSPRSGGEGDGGRVRMSPSETPRPKNLAFAFCLGLSSRQKKAMKTSRSPSLFRAWPACRAGFTLAELLVIIAVLAILITLRLSAFASAKDQSRVAQCANNLKQFTLALHIYGGETNDKLPPNTSGNWAWDMSWNTGTIITQWVSWRQLYCPGTSVRFTDQDNFFLWTFVPNSLHVINYALTLPGTSSVIPTNQNLTLTPQRISLGVTLMPAPSPAQRVLVADATISLPGQYTYSQRYTYNYTSIPGGYAMQHLSPHLNGAFPAGGNLGMLDGHVEWRKFDAMQCRVNSSPGFWW
jgi:prepilin-type processing-associated H-X9-DG protein